MPKKKKGKKMKPAVTLTLPVDPELKKLIGDAAQAAGMTMNEWVAEIAAEALGRPDLARIPRLPLGRRRIMRDKAATAS